MSIDSYALVSASNLVLDVALWDGVTTWTRPASVAQTIQLNPGEDCGAGYTYVFGGTPRFVAPAATTPAEVLLNDIDYVVGTTRSSLGTGRVATSSTSITVDKGKTNEIEFQRAALTGDVTASANSNATTIASNAVTYAKMQDVSAASKLLGRGDSGSGDPQEITLGTGLTMTGTTLSASGGGSGTVTSITAGTGLTGGTITTSGTIAADIGTGATQVAAGNHAHGNITTDGKIGSTDGLVVKTGTSGAVETLALPAGKSVLTSTASAGSLAWELASGLSGVVTVIEHTFTTSGTFTQNAACKYVLVEMCGGGGGGGNGTANGAAGIGGCGGLYWSGTIASGDLGTSTTVTIGAGGGAGVDGSATILTNATTSIVLAEVNGGRGASGSNYTVHGVATTNAFGSGGSANGSGGRHGGFGPGGGGGGHNNSTSGTAGGRACSMQITSLNPSVGGGAAGGTASGNGSNASVTVRGFGEGAGGGGGRAGTSGSVGNGGNGIRGSGGGGGGASTTAGGTGGTGGNGFVRIVEVRVA